MPKIIFDIETTGLSRVDSSPIEFAYLEVSDTGAPMRRGCIYIKPHKNNWTAGAEAVHHITREMLEQYGVDPEYAAANMYGIMFNNDIITYNGKGFDTPLIRAFCDSVGCPIPHERDHIDLCYDIPKLIGGQRRKLTDMVTEFGISTALIERMTTILFGEDERYNPHDARYDVVATFYVYKAYLKELKSRVPVL